MMGFGLTRYVQSGRRPTCPRLGLGQGPAAALEMSARGSSTRDRPGPPPATRTARSTRCGSSTPATGQGWPGRSRTACRARSRSRGAAGRSRPSAVAITGNLTVDRPGLAAGYVSVGPSVSANPVDLDDQLPARRQPGQQPDAAARRGGQAHGRLQGRRRQVDPADPRRHRLLHSPTTPGATYKPLTAARVLDTRTGAGLSGEFATNVPRTFQVTGRGGVPAGATAVTGNLTVVGQTRRGYVALTPDPVANPDTSTLNFPVGDTRANGLTLPLSAAGKLSAGLQGDGRGARPTSSSTSPATTSRARPGSASSRSTRAGSWTAGSTA